MKTCLILLLMVFSPVLVQVQDQKSPAEKYFSDVEYLLEVLAEAALGDGGDPASRRHAAECAAWNAQVGRSYRVQFKNSLSDTDWVDVEPLVTANAESASFTASINSASQRFYRVQRAP